MDNTFNRDTKAALLTEEEVHALAKRIAADPEGADGQAARDTLILRNMGLARKAARNYAQMSGLDEDELIQEAALGLFDAATRYDYTKGFKFSTYAMWWINQKIRRFISNNGAAIRKPEYVMTNLSRVTKMETALTQKLGRTPTIRELADALDESEEDVEAWKAMKSIRMESIDERVGEDGDTTRGELIADEISLTPEQNMEQQALRQAEWEVLSMLTDKQAKVLIMRTGLDGNDPMTLDEIARHPDFGVTRERIRQIESQALSRISRNPKMRRMLEDFRENRTAA